MKKKGRRNRRKRNMIKSVLYNLVLAACLAVCGWSGYHMYEIFSDNAKAEEVREATMLDVNNFADVEEAVDISYSESFKQMKDQNGDFVGWIIFDSGIINEPFVKAADNNKYLRLNYYGEYSSSGTVFQNANQDMDCRNITLYGHYVYADDSLMFTPLDRLRKQENYEENKKFKIYLENEVRDYEIVGIVMFDTLHDQESFEYWEYSDEDWQAFVDMINNRRLYDTGIEASTDDKYVTLQTCVRNREDLRTLCIGREVSRTPIIELDKKD